MVCKQEGNHAEHFATHPPGIQGELYEWPNLDAYSPAVPRRYRHARLDLSDENDLALVEWVEEGEETNLILQGPTGSGKTHKACALANWWFGRGLVVTFFSFGRLLEQMRDDFKLDDPMAPTTVDKASRANVLILDDLGIGSPSEWAMGQIDTLIDYRYSMEKRTVITHNFDAEVIQGVYGERLTRRMYEDALVLEQIERSA